MSKILDPEATHGSAGFWPNNLTNHCECGLTLVGRTQKEARLMLKHHIEARLVTDDDLLDFMD